MWPETKKSPSASRNNEYKSIIMKMQRIFLSGRQMNRDFTFALKKGGASGVKSHTHKVKGRRKSSLPREVFQLD